MMSEPRDRDDRTTDDELLATEPENDEEIDVYIGEPLDPDYLARLSKETD